MTKDGALRITGERGPGRKQRHEMKEALSHGQCCSSSLPGAAAQVKTWRWCTSSMEPLRAGVPGLARSSLAQLPVGVLSLDGSVPS